MHDVDLKYIRNVRTERKNYALFQYPQRIMLEGSQRYRYAFRSGIREERGRDWYLYLQYPS